MIQVYKKGNLNFNMNGDAVLHPVSCIFRCSLNGEWVLNLTNPIDDKLEYITEETVLKVTTPYGKQLFRVNDYDKNDQTVLVTAYPIFLDSRNEMMIFDSRAVNCNGQDALNKLFEGQDKYHGFSDIKSTATAYWQQMNPAECIGSDADNSFLNRWGGEVYYDNYDIHINEKIGNDNGLRAAFGFNLTGVSEKIDMTGVVTMIYPKSFNGHMLPQNESVDSKYAGNYAKKYKKIIEYSDIKLIEDASEDDMGNGVTVCDNLEELYDELRKRAEFEYTVNKIDIPSIGYEVNMIDLSKTDLYKDYKDLLNVNLGDTVHISHKRLNIETEARVIEIQYDCILNQVESLVLGDYVPDFFDETSSVITAVDKVIDTGNNTLMAEKITGVLNMMKTSLKAQKDIAKKQDVRAILFEDLDEESTTYGALAIGTQGIQIAKTRNETDSDWKWGTAIDFQAIYANFIIAGILSDIKGNNHWDLDKGELVTKNMKAVNAEVTGTIRGSNIESCNIHGGTINVDTNAVIGSLLQISPNNYGEKRIQMGPNVNLIGGAFTSGQAFYVDVNGSRKLRLMSDTSSLDGSNVQLFADNRIRLEANTITASTNISVSSDKRLKENINKIDISDLIDRIDIKKFDYIKGKKNVVGVIAQDLENDKLTDYIISKDKNGLLSIDYNSLSMACIQKVQKIDKEIKRIGELINADDNKK